MRHDWIVQLTGVVLQKKTGDTRVIFQPSEAAESTLISAPESATIAGYRLACVADCINGSFQGGYASRVIRTPTTSVRRPPGPHFALPK